jgi:hypothetical protein
MVTYSFFDAFVCIYWQSDYTVSGVYTFTNQTIFMVFAKCNTTTDLQYFLNSWTLYNPPFACITETIFWTNPVLIQYHSTLYDFYYPKIPDKFYGISKRNVINLIFPIPQFMTAATIHLHISLSKPQHGQNFSTKSDGRKVNACRENQWNRDAEYRSKFCK